MGSPKRPRFSGSEYPRSQVYWSCELVSEVRMVETKIRVRTEYHPVVLHTRPALEMDEE
jgi:CxxC motif-containing protein